MEDVSNGRGIDRGYLLAGPGRRQILCSDRIIDFHLFHSKAPDTPVVDLLGANFVIR